MAHEHDRGADGALGDRRLAVELRLPAPVETRREPDGAEEIRAGVLDRHGFGDEAREDVLHEIFGVLVGHAVPVDGRIAQQSVELDVPLFGQHYL